MDDSQDSSTPMDATPNVEHAQTQDQATAPVAAPTTNASSATEAEAVADTKLYAVLGYILPFLFFLPLLSETTKKDTFAMFHANQQLNLLLALVAFMVLNNVLYVVLYFIAFAIVPLIGLAILVLAIMGIINAVQGEMKELPVIGKFRLLKP